MLTQLFQATAHLANFQSAERPPRFGIAQNDSRGRRLLPVPLSVRSFTHNDVPTGQVEQVGLDSIAPLLLFRLN